MKLRSLLFAAAVGSMFFVSCSDDDDNSKPKKEDVKMETVTVNETDVVLTWVAPENIVSYEVEIVQDGQVVSSEDPVFIAPHTVTGLEANTTYTAKLYGHYADLTEDEEAIGEVTFTTKEHVGPSYGSVLELSALFPADGGNMIYMMGEYSVSFAAKSPVDAWDGSSNDAELTFYLGMSEGSLAPQGDKEDWSAKVGNSNGFSLGNMMASGTYYWKVSIEFTIDDETFTQESAISSFIVE
ncbi:MAG: fibronectin type III domain-containing protein [Bacteroidales bacterium]|nr:fibronectin type III domain-containing protein [Bacteroidales bacterium]